MDAVFSIEPSLDKTIVVNVPGWEKNLTILYSVDVYVGVSYLCWKVKETEQIFRIYATTVYEKHGINFSDHFVLTLTKFREDYKEWEAQGFPEEWMKRYYQIFNHLIQ